MHSHTTQLRSSGYPGHKLAYGSYMQIINEFPPHKMFISAFAGHCAVLQNKKIASAHDCGFEIDHAVVSNYWDQHPDFKIRNEDFLEWLRVSNPLTTGHLIYADPPYYMQSRKGQRALYDYEFTEEQHRDLAKLFHATAAMVAVSAYRCELYDELYKGWRVKEWKVQTHGGVAHEALYMNYEKPKQLHQYNFLGSNRTQRQQLKRKKNGWLNKLHHLPDQEKHMLISAVQEYLHSPAAQQHSTTTSGS